MCVAGGLTVSASHLTFIKLSVTDSAHKVSHVILCSSSCQPKCQSDRHHLQAKELRSIMHDSNALQHHPDEPGFSGIHPHYRHQIN